MRIFVSTKRVQTIKSVHAKESISVIECSVHVKELFENSFLNNRVHLERKNAFGKSAFEGIFDKIKRCIYKTDYPAFSILR